MASSSFSSVDLAPEPDLHPLYPNVAELGPLLSQNSGLAPSEKQELVTHCLTRACVFGDLSVLSFLLTDRQAQSYVDLSIQDEDGLGLISITIHGFGAESERDVEREECVRLLIAQGIDVNLPDKAGWTPLHHAALLAPPTLISHLMTHGCAIFAQTRRGLTALDIVTAHTILPGREDVALLLEEAMRSEGWTGGRMEERRRSEDQRLKRKGKQRIVRKDIEKLINVHPTWWGDGDSDGESSSGEESEGDENESIYTPAADYSTMLVFSPPSLPQIFDSLINNFPPTARNAQPANTLYMLARFACLTCDHTWLEDLIIGATDAIEETFFENADDITCLIFWLYNTTLWLHLMECDRSINEACEMLGSFDLIEEVINSVFVFIIRFAERKIDKLVDEAILEHTPLPAEFDAIQFESEWSLFRPFSSKKKAPPSSPPAKTETRSNGLSSPPLSPSRPPSPSPRQSLSGPPSKGLATLKQSFTRSRGGSSTNPLQSLFSDPSPSSLPADITSFMTALHTLLTSSGINPAFITQLWSQVLYWTSCEVFNRVLTRKKYLCRSRAVRIGMNLDILEDWVTENDLPPGVHSHFTPVRDLLSWLQCLSAINDFSVLVATVQSLKNINPLQMRRAVRDYKYEVNEGRMTEECTQYLTQLQKDWERHRVKLGVEALRKEIDDRDRDQEGSVSSHANDLPTSAEPAPSISTVSSETSAAQQYIDLLFDKTQEKATWEPVRPPQALGELLDSRHMLPLFLPSNPRHLSAFPGKLREHGEVGHRNGVLPYETRSASRASYGSQGSMAWRSRDRKIRDVGVEVLQWVDGAWSAARWGRSPTAGDEDFHDEDDRPPSYSSDDPHILLDDNADTLRISTTPLTRKPSLRSKGRPSIGEEITPVEQRTL